LVDRPVQPWTYYIRRTPRVQYVFFIHKRLTYEAVAGATGLRSTAVHVEVGVTAGPPLAEDAGRGVYDVHEMRVRGVEVSGPVVAHVKYDRRVQAGDPTNLTRLDEVGREAGYVSSDAVSG